MNLKIPNVDDKLGLRPRKPPRRNLSISPVRKKISPVRKKISPLRKKISPVRKKPFHRPTLKGTSFQSDNCDNIMTIIFFFQGEKQ